MFVAICEAVVFVCLPLFYTLMQKKLEFFNCFIVLNYRIGNLIFMNLTSAARSTVSCRAGSNSNFLFWILVCFLLPPSFLGAPEVVYVHSQLIELIVGFPSSSIWGVIFWQGTPIVLKFLSLIFCILLVSSKSHGFLSVLCLKWK